MRTFLKGFLAPLVALNSVMHLTSKTAAWLAAATSFKFPFKPSSHQVAVKAGEPNQRILTSGPVKKTKQKTIVCSQDSGEFGSRG